MNGAFIGWIGAVFIGLGIVLTIVGFEKQSLPATAAPIENPLPISNGYSSDETPAQRYVRTQAAWRAAIEAVDKEDTVAKRKEKAAFREFMAAEEGLKGEVKPAP